MFCIRERDSSRENLIYSDARELWGRSSFFKEVVEWKDPEQGFDIYALALAIRNAQFDSELASIFPREESGI